MGSSVTAGSSTGAEVSPTGKRTRIIVVLATVLLGMMGKTVVATGGVVQEHPGDAYEAGRALIDAGDAEGALAFWVGMRDSLFTHAVADARIATAFVQAVTENDLERYEEVATMVFYWGFSGVVTGAARQEVLDEGRRTFTLVDSMAVEYWDAVGRQDPKALSLAIKRFWIERDPTPTTPLNERLIEHWKRISYARENFAYNRSSAYDTDDRGRFYVKYGLPDRVTRGHLGVSESERRFRGLPLDFIARFDQQPQYEVWRYATMHPGEFTYFLFGNTQGTGPFRHVQGLHEIIPTSARVSGEARHQGIRAHYYLELFYYEDLAPTGGPFGLRFGELERLWNRARRPVEGTLEAISRRHIADDQWAARTALPYAISELDDRPRSALSAQVARILKDDEPRLMALAVSSPIWLPDTEVPTVGDSLTLAPYTASYTVIVRDSTLSEIARAGMLPVDGPGHLSTLVLRQPTAIRHMSVSARHDVHDFGDTTPRQRLPGQVHFVVSEPLQSNIGLEVSDLIVGIAPRPELDLGDLPVPLLPATRFWRDDLLRVYFEVYRSNPAQTGILDVSVQLQPIESINPVMALPETEEPDPETATITLALESPATHETHSLDLDLRNERAGLLRIIVQVTDRETGTTRVRTTVARLLQY